MYSPEQIAEIVGCPIENVQTTWPSVLEALNWQGINDKPTRIAMIATIGVETWITVGTKVMTFLPITEIGAENARYAPYYGRGLIQATWEANYSSYGPRMNPPRDCVHNPDIMLEVVPSAQFAALYFIDHDISGSARAGDWGACRTKVNGGWNGWPRFIALVNALLATPESDWTPAPTHPPVTTVAVRDQLRQRPVNKPPDALDAHHQPVVLEVGKVVHFLPDPTPGPYHGKVTTPNWCHINVDGTPIHGWFRRDHLQTK